MAKTLQLIAVGVCISVCQIAPSAMSYVDGSASEFGDGSSWESPLQTIQLGIDMASDGDTVIVAEGGYRENIHFDGKNIKVTSTDPLDPYVVAGTIIDGNQAGSVVTFAGTEDETCVLSGFTIRNGTGTMIGDSLSAGGGIYGGFPATTRATIENNIVVGNSVSFIGGALYHCRGTIQHNVVTGNSAGQDGGGLFRCNGTIQGNAMTANSAERSGGGLHECNGVIQNNLIAGNSAAVNGGGLSNCHRMIVNNTIYGNSAGSHGGGLAACRGVIRNCIIWANTAAGVRSELYESSIPSFCCIQGWGGGGLENIAPKYGPQFVDPDGPDDDPRTHEDNDYRLAEDSPCKDAGVNYFWVAWPQRELDRGCRLVGERVDMGCYEYGSSPDSDGDLVADADESAGGTDPDQEDTDGDFIRDGLELLRGSDPLVSTPLRIVHVPSDIATIQQSLCLAASGEEIVVNRGTYHENVVFCGNDVILRSSDPHDRGIVESTIIDGRREGPVLSLIGHETEASIIAGFTIRNGKSENGGGICGGPEDHGSWCPTPSHATIQNNIITGNVAAGEWGRGGGVAYCNGAILNNVIIGNSAASCGGGLGFCGFVRQFTEFPFNGPIQNNLIVGNSAPHWGGGVAACTGTIRNNTIVGNSTGGSGGGLDECSGTVLNNTIVSNSAARGGGVASGSDSTIRNCIIWGNTASEGPQLSDVSEPTYSCIQDWTGTGVGNITEPPLFLDPDGPDNKPQTYEDNDYRLSPNSPCVDKGKNEDWMVDALALNGSPRIIDFGDDGSAIVDMGAYEAREFIPPVLTLNGELSIILECGAPYIEPGYTATDNYDGDITDRVVVTGWVDPTSRGSHPLRYNVKDSSGNRAPEKVRLVEVRDTTPPVITLLGDNPMTIQVGTPYVEPGYTVTDSCDGDVTAFVVVSGSVDSNAVGTYILLYNAIDWSVNPAQVTRTVNVVETVFRVVEILPVGGQIRLTWTSRPGATYTVWSCGDPCAGLWTEEATIDSQGDSTEWTDPETACMCKFYRIELR
ncbi:MAG: DUF5011 domain-containing protein [bacterium]|nr:DUF5011 domain-containing protein [bacterium]